MTTTDTPRAELAPGSRIGPFIITGVLGRGGMGIVYAGKHEHTGVEAAIKTVVQGSATLMSHVRHEAATLSRIRHPGVVQILSFGVEAGRPWYAMERLSGRTLLDVVEHNSGAHDDTLGVPPANAATQDTSRPVVSTVPTALHQAMTRAQQSVSNAATLHSGNLGEQPGNDTPVAAAPAMGALPSIPTLPIAQMACNLGHMLPLMRGVCDALAYVHGEGVVHRDLKPANIFIRTGELPVLVDFGLATHVGADGRDVLQYVGGVAGSLAYMAPEQLRGELLDARCDLYALGCILYQLVTGRLPFQGFAQQVVFAHLGSDPVPPSRLVIGVPDVLDELILGLLIKDRDHRIGSAEAVDVVLATLSGPCAWPVSLPPARPFLYRPPFVGRRDEFRRLAERLQRFILGSHEARSADKQQQARQAIFEHLYPAHGNDTVNHTADAPVTAANVAGSLVLVSGESGAGKTRLALEAVKFNAESTVTTILCECARGGVPFQPLRELFNTIVEHCVEAGPDETARVFGSDAAVLALYSPEIGSLPGVAELPEPEPLPSAAARARVFRCLTEMLRAFTQTRPLLLILDDLHLGDPFTLGFLAHLHEQHDRGRAPHMLVLGCYRSEERNAALEPLAGYPETLHLTVERMSEVEVGQMVRGMLALADPPPAFVAFLARESGGNPFFVTEYLRTAVAERVLVRDRRGGWQIADSQVPTEAMCEALPLPRSLRQVVELRLGRFDAGVRSVLDAAAVIGRRFSAPLLRAVLGLDEETLLEALDAMIAAHVIEPLENQNYRFVHDKLHELPVAALPPAQRQALHARVAQAMEERHAAALGEHRATIGRHWAEAGEPRRATGHLHAAGDRASKVHSVDAAIAHYRAAREQIAAILSAAAPLCNDSERETWRAQARELDEKLGDALALSSQHALAREAFTRVLDDLPAAESFIATRARMIRKIGKTWESVHAYAEALASYTELEALIENRENNPAATERATRLESEWIQLMLGRAWIYYWSGRVDEMNAVIAQVRPVIETRGSALDRYRFYLALVTRNYRRDRYRMSAETLECGRECVAAARAANAVGEIAFARFVRGFGLVFSGQLREAEAELEAALQAARKISDAVAETRAIAYLGLVHRLAGHVDETATTASAALGMARARKMNDYEGMSLGLLGWVTRARGDHDKAGERCRAALAVWNAMSYPFPFRWIASLILLEQEIGKVPARELAKLAGELTTPTQHHLPDPLDLALRQASEHDEPGNDDAVEQAAGEAVALAIKLGYL